MRLTDWIRDRWPLAWRRTMVDEILRRELIYSREASGYTRRLDKLGDDYFDLFSAVVEWKREIAAINALDLGTVDTIEAIARAHHAERKLLAFIDAAADSILKEPSPPLSRA